MCWQNAEVRDCNIVTCPLWQYRPFRDKNGKAEAEVITAITEIIENEQEYMVEVGSKTLQD